jgi:glycosyltransferase-like protein
MRSSVGLVTYSTKPRGGVVHTLALAEELHRQGVAVEVVALGDPGIGFYRHVDAPRHLIPAPPPLETLEERVAAAIDALTEGLREMRAAGSLPPILHVQDCISARAAVRLRDEGASVVVVRTVHHVDDFTTPDLIECQLRSILDPDQLLAVSRMWRDRLADEYGVEATVVSNGVDQARFAVAPTAEEVERRRAQVGAAPDRFLVLTIGGIEPRKGSDHLVRSMALLRQRLQPSPVLAVIGGHSFQDHRAYRDAVLASLPGLGLELGRDVVLLGTVADAEIPVWYHAADAFAFPSVNEGFGLVVLEALAAGTPTVVADLPVFREYLVKDRDALVVRPGDDEDLAEQLHRLATDEALRTSLIGAGHDVAARFTWAACARQHRAIYTEIYDEVLGAPRLLRRT